MSYITEIYLVICFFIYFFYGIVNYYSSHNNYVYSFSGCHFLLLQILFNSICLLNITSLDFNFILNSTLFKDSSILEIENLLLCISFIFICTTFNTNFKINYFEYYLIIFISILATLFLISSHNFILFFLLIEIQSVSLYVLAVFNRNDKSSIEATFKYFIIGSISSFLLLLFIVFLYGFIGLFSFFDLYFFLKIESYHYYFEISYLLCFLFLLISILFKMYAVPFHFWVAEIYQSSLILSTFFFSTFYFLLINFIFLKLYLYFFIQFQFYFKYIYFFFSVLSIIFSVLGALNEFKLRKLIAYSSISCTGYFLGFFIINDLFFFNNGFKCNIP